MRAALIGLLILGVLIPFVALRRQEAPASADGELATARDVLAQSRKAYCAAPALLDTMVMTDVSTRRGAPQTYEIAIAGDDQIRLTTQGIAIIAVDGFAYIDRSDVPDKYAKIGPHDKAADGMVATFAQSFGPGSMVPPQIAMRADGVDESGLLRAISLSAVQAPRLSSHQQLQDEDGRTVHVIHVEDDAGPNHAIVTIDDETKLLSALSVSLVPPPDRQGSPLTREVTFAPRVVDSLPTPVAYAPGDRTAVAQFRDLRPTPPGTGTMAPDFTLSTLEGEEVTLSDLRGSVVVLDFWATWCGPCRQALPKLSKFNDWVTENDRPVKVFGVNTWERGDPATAQKKVAAYWSSQGFSMPTLRDSDSRVVGMYGVRSIPSTYVIGPDGRVVAVHVGMAPNMIELLQQDVAKAMQSAG